MESHFEEQITYLSSKNQSRWHMTSISLLNRGRRRAQDLGGEQVSGWRGYPSITLYDQHFLTKNFLCKPWHESKGMWLLSEAGNSQTFQPVWRGAVMVRSPQPHHSSRVSGQVQPWGLVLVLQLRLLPGSLGGSLAPAASLRIRPGNGQVGMDMQFSTSGVSEGLLWKAHRSTPHSQRFWFRKAKEELFLCHSSWPKAPEMTFSSKLNFVVHCLWIWKTILVLKFRIYKWNITNPCLAVLPWDLNEMVLAEIYELLCGTIVPCFT